MLIQLACSPETVIDSAITEPEADSAGGGPSLVEEVARVEGTLLINEVMADKDHGGDWLEIFNAGSSEVLLGLGWQLATDDVGLDESEALTGTVPAGGWLRIPCDGSETDDPDVHAMSFPLEMDGDGLMLLEADEVVNRITWGALTSDANASAGLTLARTEDGGEAWDWAEETPGATNAP